MPQIEIGPAQIQIRLTKLGIELRGFLQQWDGLGILPTLKQTETVIKGSLGV